MSVEISTHIDDNEELKVIAYNGDLTCKVPVVSSVIIETEDLE